MVDFSDAYFMKTTCFLAEIEDRTPFYMYNAALFFLFLARPFLVIALRGR
jgi:hypothetical protein